MQKFTNASLKKYNTFHVDVKTNHLYICDSINELFTAITEVRERGERILVLGGGSNILFTKNFEGSVIIPDLKGIEIIEENESDILIKAGAGEVWDDLVKYCVKRNLWGIENLSLIPGSVGAAPIQNIGAYGVELVDVFVSLNALDIDTLAQMSFDKEDCNFSYRSSIFKERMKNKFIITDVTIKLQKHAAPNLTYTALKNEVADIPLDQLTINDISEVVRKIRQSKLPDVNEIGNCGSFFKNAEVETALFLKLKKNYPDLVYFELPEGKYKIAAGWLIDKSGLKGFRTGDVGTYPKQALVIVNYGNAAGQDILEFANYIRQKVYEKFQIELQTEVNIIN